MNAGCNRMILFIANLVILGHYLKSSTISNQQYLLKQLPCLVIHHHQIEIQAGQSHKKKLSISLIKKKNLLLAQIKSSFLPEQKIALDHLLLHVKSKIRSLRKAEKSCKRRSLLKKVRNDFKRNPYKASKSLLDPKCFVSLKVDQTNLDQHRAFSFNDQSYDVPSGELQGLPP